ncbi:hypothetical protein ACDY96_17080 [Rhizobium mongolense]|uniref:hypothetical protein n=2 Tax=Rhizobium TaxID=379 RepID=UPI003558B0D8
MMKPEENAGILRDRIGEKVWQGVAETLIFQRILFQAKCGGIPGKRLKALDLVIPGEAPKLSQCFDISALDTIRQAFVASDWYGSPVDALAASNFIPIFSSGVPRDHAGRAPLVVV